MILTGLVINQLIAPIPDPPAMGKVFAASARHLAIYLPGPGRSSAPLPAMCSCEGSPFSRTRGSGWQYFGRYLVGIAGVLAIFWVWMPLQLVGSGCVRLRPGFAIYSLRNGHILGDFRCTMGLPNA